MSRFERVKQWAAFSRNWHIYDAKWQNPFQSARVITKVGPSYVLRWSGVALNGQQTAISPGA